MASFGVMASGPVFLVSDVHLGAVPGETEEAFRRWLRHVRATGSRLIINGDLFDFWFEYRTVVFSKHVRVLALLADLVESGVPVLVMGGNHDWWGGDFLRSEIGVDFRQEPARIRVSDKSVLVAHGDGLGAGDFGYRMLRLVLRGRLTRWLFRWIHPDIGARLADRVSGTRDQLGSGAAPASAGRTAFLSRWAATRLEQDPTLDIVALGHGHEPVVTEVDPGRFYVNSGDWVLHRSYVTIDDSGRPVLHEWDG
ncbi:MAG: UDP-2,3-diacylglucosamine diphosphatase [Gammaproteobacteria bacterium]|nr:UDP-2,3-diacylglucosamine diphosphatase [Gammaproteobacteria bacterium]